MLKSIDKYLLFGLFMAFFSVSTYALTIKGTNIIPFKEWKSSKIAEAQILLNESKSKLANINDKKQFKAQVKSLEDEISDEELSFEVAQALTIRDYIVLYLSGQPEKDKYLTAAQSLSPNEVSILMEEYAQGVKSPNLKKALILNRSSFQEE